ncbi:MAG: hypothetical protein J6Y07_02465 [Alphaproteobacteria bacterium]|nr:hypothetical protein [Alphaproteobacteria bacterium]
MGSVADFERAMEILRQRGKNFEVVPGYQDYNVYIATGRSEADIYMSDMNNWCLVHATRYIPSRNLDGRLFIPTTSMATNFDDVRPTVHTTLNHVVSSNGGGNWDGVPYVILARYNDVVALNGNPKEVSQYDTFFIPDPDNGLVLPQDACLVRPSNEKNGELYVIGEHEATYKTSNFTDDEIERILNMIRESYGATESGDLYYKYDSYLGKENDEETMRILLGKDEKLFKIYKNTVNKKDFLKGLLAEDRDAIMAKFLRDAVVKLAMEKQGFRYVNPSEGSAWTDNIARTAREHGIVASSNNKGHSASIEMEMESGANWLIANLKNLYAQGQDIDKIFSLIESKFNDDGDKRVNRLFKQVVWCMKTGKPLDLYPSYQRFFMTAVDMYEDKYDGRKYANISDYSSALDITMRRSAIVVKNTFSQWLNDIKRGPNREKFDSKLAEFLGKFDQHDLINAFKSANSRF